MRVFRHISDVPGGVVGRVAAYGDFDGLHLGHRRLLDELAGSPAERRFVLFDGTTLREASLSSRRRCLEEFAARGVASVVVLSRPDSDVVAAVRALAPAVVLAGAGEPVPSWFRDIAGARAVEPVLLAGHPVSSKRLRAAIVAGDVRTAAAMAGGPYRVGGRVVRGFRRGVTIGVPTANLRVRDLQLPPDGVYAVTVWTDTFSGVGVANLGTNPTFGNRERSLETNIFDFEGDLYGARLEVGFVAHLRREKKFDGVASLTAQIRRDIDAARAIHSSR